MAISNRIMNGSTEQKMPRVRIIAKYSNFYGKVGEVLEWSYADNPYVKLEGHDPMWFLKEEVEEIDA